MASEEKKTALNLSSLPKIVGTIRELQRTIENQSGVDPEDGTPCHPAWPTLRVKWRLNDLLNPSGGGIIWPAWNLKKNSDIDESQLPRSFRLALRKLWETTFPVGWANLACDQSDEWLTFLDEIATMLEGGGLPEPVNSISAHEAKPSWDGCRLVFNDVIVKEYKKHPATNQRKLLTAFQAAGWPSSIKDPWHDPRLSTPLRTLNETLRALNKSIRQGTIRFEATGNGHCRWITL